MGLRRLLTRRPHGSNKLWTTREKETLRIRDMTDMHLYHTIRMLERAHAAKVHAMPFYWPQGEMAQYYAEQELAHLFDSVPGDFYPIYNNMVEDAAWRGMYDRNGVLCKPVNMAISPEGLVDLRRL